MRGSASSRGAGARVPTREGDGERGDQGPKRAFDGSAERERRRLQQHRARGRARSTPDDEMTGVDRRRAPRGARWEERRAEAPSDTRCFHDPRGPGNTRPRRPGPARSSDGREDRGPAAIEEPSEKARLLGRDPADEIQDKRESSRERRGSIPGLPRNRRREGSSSRPAALPDRVSSPSSSASHPAKRTAAIPARKEGSRYTQKGAPGPTGASRGSRASGCCRDECP